MAGILINWFKHNVSHGVRYTLLGLFTIMLLSGVGYLTHDKFTALQQKETPLAVEDDYVAFLEEVYDTIAISYWNNVEEALLVDFYKRISESLLEKQLTIANKTRDDLISVLTLELHNMINNTKRKEFVVGLSAQVLNGLEPIGRSGLFTQQATKDLADRVNNADNDANLYEDLGVPKDANDEQIANAAKTRQEDLQEKAKTSTEAKQELEKVVYAKEVLTDTRKKERYDSIGALPTVFLKKLSSNIVHLYISQFSPSTFDEFVQILNKADSDQKSSVLILDVRGNVGGSFDVIPYILGPLIGPGNYAFNLFSKEVQDPVVTTTGWLDSLQSYKKIVILADQNTQSSGEVFVSTLKKYNVGIFVGKQTRGWGTIERVFPIEHQISSDEEYGMFLVHSITLGDDNQPIEGRGITPDINIENNRWQQELQEYWSDMEITQTIQTLWNEPLPGK